MFATVIAMLSAITGVDVTVVGSAVKVFAYDVEFDDNYDEIDNPDFDVDVFDDFLDFLTDNGAKVSGSVWGTMVYDFGDFSVSVSYSSSDI